MSRQWVTVEELKKELNNELSKHPECADCEFDRIVLNRDVGEGECNWSGADLQCHGGDIGPCAKFQNQIVEEARKKFNVKE